MSAPQEKQASRGIAPRPGSDAARRLSCRCPVIDNNHGRGAYVDDDGEPIYWITDSCPLHGAASAAQHGSRQ